MKRPQIKRPRWLGGESDPEAEAEPPAGSTPPTAEVPAPEHEAEPPAGSTPPTAEVPAPEHETEPPPEEQGPSLRSRLEARARRLAANARARTAGGDADATEAPGLKSSDDVSAGASAEEEKPEDSREQAASGLGFRASTRVRAAGYWARERAQSAGKLASEAAGHVSAFWGGRSQRSRIQIAAVAGVVLLYVLLRFTALPGVPCSVSAVKSCAPGDDVVAVVPADSLLYAHITLDEDTEQAELAAEAFDQLPELERVLVGGAGAAVSTGAVIDLRADVLPWANDDLAAAVVPGAQAKDPPSQAFIAGVSDREGAEAFLSKVAPTGGAPRAETQGERELDIYPGGFAAAFVGERLAFGEEAAVRAILDTASNGRPELEDSAEGEPRDGLSEDRFADVYLSRAGVKALLRGGSGAASQLETFVDYGATSGLAAELVAVDDGLEIGLISQLDPELIASSPSFFATLPEFEPDLAGTAGSRAIGYVGVGEIGPTVAEILGQAGADAGGLAASLRALAGELETEAGINPLQDLLPALGGQAALVAEPTAGRPFASLIIEDVSEEEAGPALARLQGPLLRAAGSGAEGGRVPRFVEAEVDGVLIRSVELSPVVNLAYALTDGRLIVSTSPQGVREALSGGEKLDDTDAYEAAVDRLPDTVSALVFLNLDELFGQIEAIGLAEDPSFADLTVLFENASSVGLAVNGDDDLIRTELFLALD